MYECVFNITGTRQRPV